MGNCCSCARLRALFKPSAPRSRNIVPVCNKPECLPKPPVVTIYGEYSIRARVERRFSLNRAMEIAITHIVKQVDFFFKFTGFRDERGFISGVGFRSDDSEMFVRCRAGVFYGAN